MSGTQQFTCFECALQGREAQVTLDANGRCGVCHSDAVLTKDQTETIAMRSVQSTQSTAKPTQQQVRTRIIEQTREARKYYYISEGLFETVVSWQDAATLEQALEVAYNKLHPWYRSSSHWASKSQISHSEYCDWLRSH